MEEGIILTQDKREIDVFFLKPQGSFSPHPDEPNTWIVNDEETAKALIEDNIDCCEDLHLMNEQDVNENSAGGGAHSGYIYDSEDVLKEIKGCCPVGHKGETGWKGYDNLYDAILDTIRRFKDSQLNIASETAQEVLAMSIEGKVKHFYDER